MKHYLNKSFVHCGFFSLSFTMIKVCLIIVSLLVPLPCVGMTKQILDIEYTKKFLFFNVDCHVGLLCKRKMTSFDFFFRLEKVPDCPDT